ncbi:MAG TPA: amidohydrolase family protein [Polyangiaceae bacterium]
MSDARTIVYSRRVLVPGADGVEERRAAIFVRGSLVDEVRLDPDERALASEAKGAGWRLDDFGRALVAPAFVNAHTHLAMSALRGIVAQCGHAANAVESVFFRLEASLQPGDVRAFARLGAYESLLAGVGLVWDHYYAGLEVAEALRDTGLAGVVAPTLQDLSGPGRDTWERELEATLAVHGDASFTAAGVVAALGPHATDTVSLDLFRRASDLARANGLPLHCHVAQSPEEVVALGRRHGTTPLDWLLREGLLDVSCAVLAHCLYADAGELRRLDRSRHVLALCPYSQLEFGVLAPAALWDALGLQFVVATDSAASNDSMNPQKELRLLANLPALRVAFSESYARATERVSMDRARAVASLRAECLDASAAWIEPGRLLERLWRLPGALHPQLSAGELLAGRLANLAVYDVEHPSLWPADDALRSLCFSDAAPALVAVMVNGSWVGTPGAGFAQSVTASVEYRDALREAEARRRALLVRAGLA